MANATEIKYAFAGHDIYDFTRYAAILLMYGASVKTTKNWIRACTVITFIFGVVCLVIPSTLLRIQFEMEATPLQTFLVQIMACGYLAQAICTWRVWRESRDDSVTSAILWNLVVEASLHLIIYGYYIGKVSLHQVFILMLIGFLTNLGSVYQLLTNRFVTTNQCPNSAVTWILRFDFLFTFIFALLYLAFPDWVVDFLKLSTGFMNYLMLRHVGAVFLASSILSFSSASFRQPDDLKEIFNCRILTLLLMLLVLLYDHAYRGVLPGRWEFWKSSLFLVHSIPAAVGIIVTGKFVLRSHEEYVHYTRSKGKAD